MMHIGCHLSVSKGYEAMGLAALSVEADTFQFFSRNPRGGSIRPFDGADAEKLVSIMAEHAFAPVIIHAPYTYNPCAGAEKALTYAREAMAEDLLRADAIPNALYNLHPGCHTGRGVEAGIELIAETLKMAAHENMKTTVLLETMAGKGSEIGGRFEELREIIDRVKDFMPIGVCMDTCHVYDAGYDIVNDLDGVLTEFDKAVGLDYLKAVHINDSKNPMGSHKDRHECIGKGSVGTEAFGRIINHPALKELPFVLETPNELDGYHEEIRLLRSLSKEG